MKSIVLSSRHWLFLLFFLLSACSGATVREPGFKEPGFKEPGGKNKQAYQARADQLNAISVWGLVGRISLDDGDQGGSGRLQWDVKPGNSELDFHGALGRGAWNLQIGPERAVLKEASGVEQHAAGVNALIQDRIGWPIPVDALQWWVRGLMAPGVTGNKEINAEGQMISLHQFGWNIDFSRYDSFDGVVLPIKLKATRDSYRVKLAISRWQMNVSDGQSN